MHAHNNVLVHYELTRSNGVDKGADDLAVLPVGGEVGDGSVWDFALDPVEQPLLGRLLLLQVGLAFLVLPHRHRDGVVQNERPYQTEDQLQLAVYDVRRVCEQRTSKLNPCSVHTI